MNTASRSLRNVFDGEPLLRTIATAVVRMSRRGHPGDPVYDDVTQRAFDQLVLLCLRKRLPPPASIPGMMQWARTRPFSQWPLTLTSGDFAEHQFLVDLETKAPTQFCMEWAMITVGDPSAEQFENSLMQEALSACRTMQSPRSYTALRRLFVERPVITASELGNLASEVDLLPLLDLVRQSYEPAPASNLRNGCFHVCSRCGCLLIPTATGSLRCDLDRCLREGNSAVARSFSPYEGGGTLQLSRPLRTFITGPGLAEKDLETALNRLGLTPEMWPNFDSYDLRISLPDGQVWAVDVKDRANPALLARTTAPFRTVPSFTKAFFVFPAYRVREREDYERVFQRNLAPELMGNFQFCTDKKFIAKVRREMKLASKEDERNA